MDDIHTLVNGILEKILASSLSDTEKADAMASLSLGMRRLVWPILLTHVPEYLLAELKEKKNMTMEEYLEIIESAFKNPATARQMHDEVKAALLEVDVLVKRHLG